MPFFAIPRIYQPNQLKEHIWVSKISHITFHIVDDVSLYPSISHSIRLYAPYLPNLRLVWHPGIPTRWPVSGSGPQIPQIDRTHRWIDRRRDRKKEREINTVCTNGHCCSIGWPGISQKGTYYWVGTAFQDLPKSLVITFQEDTQIWSQARCVKMLTWLCPRMGIPRKMIIHQSWASNPICRQTHLQVFVACIPFTLDTSIWIPVAVSTYVPDLLSTCCWTFQGLDERRTKSSMNLKWESCMLLLLLRKFVTVQKQPFRNFWWLILETIFVYFCAV